MPAALYKPLQAWINQATRAAVALDAKLPPDHGHDVALRDLEQLDHDEFADLIEALVALEPYTGQKVDEDLIQLAGLITVDQALGLGEGRDP
jgi:hypothetical protein